jgi:hypothetical protein
MIEVLRCSDPHPHDAHTWGNGTDEYYCVGVR